MNFSLKKNPLAFKWTLLIAFLRMTVFSLPADAAEVYTYQQGGKSVQVSIVEIGGLRMNDLCFNLGEKCQALKALKNPDSSKLKTPQLETWAANYCQNMGGSNLVLSSPRGSSSLFCLFQDLSMIDGRALVAAARGKTSQ